MIWAETAAEVFVGAYPERPVLLEHNLVGHNLFTLDRLAKLATDLPVQLVEYNRGDLTVEQDPDTTPANGLSVEETVRSIHENGSWMVLKNVQADPDYAALLETCLASLGGLITPATGALYRKEGFIFISSPNSVTPFHMDPEHNILMQVSGEKSMKVYPAGAKGALTSEQHEDYHENGHRNLSFLESLDEHAQNFLLQPGYALHVPVKAPHWVHNGNDVSISFSITWRSRLSFQEANLHRMNALLRRNGFKPRSAGKSSLLDWGKATAYRTLGKTGLIRN